MGGAPQAGGAQEPPEGFVSVAFAEAKWQEREQQFAAQLAALQALVATGGPEPAASATPSEASDVQCHTDLDVDLDDEGWKKVGKQARKAIAAKHRTAIAGKVAASIGKVGKVACPFQKSPKKGQ